jgi:hypothetical protein
VPILAASVFAGTVTLTWDAVTDPDLAGYRVYTGPSAGTYDQVKDVDASTTTAAAQVPDCQVVHAAVKAIDTADQESLEFSNELDGWPRPLVLVAQDSNTGSNRFKTPRGNQPWDYTVRIRGLNFMAGSTVEFSNPEVEVLSVVVNGCGEIIATIRTTNATTTGLSDVSVIHPDTVFGTGAGLVEFFHGPSPVGGLQMVP